jgi:SAM-dependent methyltransferase
VSGERVVEAYGRRADEYAAVLGSMDAVHDEDRALVDRWADARRGTVLDAGCGPGHWSAYLADRGHDVVGLDAVPRFVAIARAARPGVDFRVGTLERTGLATGSVGGVLAWYSLVHHAPGDVPAALDEFHRVLQPGGGVLVGFFEAAVLEPFDHAVTTAWRWPVDRMAALVADAGFAVEAVVQRTDAGARPHAAVVAVRGPDGSADRG